MREGGKTVSVRESQFNRKLGVLCVILRLRSAGKHRDGAFDDVRGSSSRRRRARAQHNVYFRAQVLFTIAPEIPNHCLDLNTRYVYCAPFHICTCLYV